MRNNMTISLNQSIAYDDIYSRIPRTDLMLGNSFNIAQAAVDSVSSFMARTFAREPLVPNINGWYIEGSGNRQYFPEIMKVLRTILSLQGLFQGVGVSMTNAIRDGSDDRLTQEGELCRQATIYRIEWPWLILPICIVATGLVQLALSILRTYLTNTPLWKFSQLAVLSSGRCLSDFLDHSKSLSGIDYAAIRTIDRLNRVWIGSVV